MGDRLTKESNPKQTSPTPYGDIFDELFPHYLLMGMTPEQYWDGEGFLKKAYLKAYRIRMENEQKAADVNNWLMGQYIMYALQAMPLLVAGLNVKPSTKLPEYPNKPLLEKADAQKKEDTRRKQEEDQTRLMMAMFQAGIAKFNKRFKKEHSQSAESGQ